MTQDNDELKQEFSLSQGISSTSSGVRADQLSALLARVESAEGPDRALDGAICRACGDTVASNEIGGFIWKPADAEGWRSVPKLTASLDASLALCERVLPTATWDVGSVERIDRKFYSAIVWPANGGPDSGECHSDANPALALIAAMLRALLASNADTSKAEEGLG